MYHGFKSVQIRFRHFTKVLAYLWKFWGRLPEVTTIKEICVETNYCMSLSSQHLPRYGADVTLMTSQEYFHWVSVMAKV